jgi:hypothetical protein
MESCKNCKALLPSHLIMLYCPECGITIINIEKRTEKKKFRKQGKVSIKRQILLTILPLLLFVTSYKIFKLRKTVLIYTILSIGSFLYLALFFHSYMPPIFYPDDSKNHNLNPLLFISSYFTISFWNPPSVDMVYFIISFWILPSIVMVYFITKWSKLWNKKIAFIESFK